MKTSHHFKWNLITVMIVTACALVFGQHKSVSADESGAEVLTRGPVHEAFAQTVAFDPDPAYSIRRAPPEMIEELPPEISMDGDNVAWIPGYWAWDEDDNDFIWISGVWRSLPPGRQWVPGYWNENRGTYLWISGYWADAEVSETQYLPRPPRTIEVGPNIAAPSQNHTWIPGCWVWNRSRYAWRPGYWAACRTDWIWVPSHYVCAPRGYIYVDGYWDYGITRRGVLFAPVHFDVGYFTTASFRFSPSIVIDLSVIVDSLFVRPRYSHYYFGDYYDPVYVDVGYYPCHSYYSERRGYDPIYAYRRWEHRDIVNWEVNIETNYYYRRDHIEARPPRTYRKEREFYAQERTSQHGNIAVAATLGEFAERRDRSVRFKTLGNEEREKFGQHGKEVGRFREERRKLEAKVPEPSKSSENRSTHEKVAKVPFSRSPIMGKPAEKFGKDHEPPQSHDMPKVDDSIRPRSKRFEGSSDNRPGPDVNDKRGDSRESGNNKERSDRGSESQMRSSDHQRPDHKSDQPTHDTKPESKSDGGEKSKSAPDGDRSQSSSSKGKSSESHKGDSGGGSKGSSKNGSGKKDK